MECLIYEVDELDRGVSIVIAIFLLKRLIEYDDLSMTLWLINKRVDLFKRLKS